MGLSYKKSSVAVRNRFAISEDSHNKLTKKFSELNIEDVLILSTCNRSEIYYLDKSDKDVSGIFSQVFDSTEDEINELMHSLQGTEVLKHFFAVASGLDSQITGDYDIINQIKETGIAPGSKYKLSNFMERMVSSALNTSKLVKKHTGISDGRTSVSYAAVHYLKEKIRPEFHDHTLIIGTGAIGSAVAQNFNRLIPDRPLILSNRNQEKAEKLAENLSKTAIAPFEELDELFKFVNIILVCTAAQGSNVVKASQLHPDRHYHILDLSLPSNVDDDIKDLPNVSYYNIDEVSQLVSKTLASRKSEIPKAEEIINQKVKEFIKWDSTQKYSPYLKLTKEQLYDASMHQACPFSSSKDNDQKINDLVKNMAKKARVGEIHACSYINAFIDLMEKRSEKKELLKIGTRDSSLAMYQAHKVEEKLLKLNLNCAIKTIKSEGDLDLQQPLYDMGIEGVFTKALDTALVNDQIDFAVHSLKDVPTSLANGLSLAGVLKRAAHQDVAILKKGLKWEELYDQELTVASSSIRRRAQWKYRFPRHRFKNIRGNIQTRLKKFYEGNYDILIMAKAAIDRLEMKIDHTVVLDSPPSPGQGIIGIVCRTQDAELIQKIQQFSHSFCHLEHGVENNLL